MNALNSFAVTPAEALRMDAGTVLALSQEDTSAYHIAAVAGWMEAFEKSADFELQYKLVKEEMMELAAAGTDMTANPTVDAVCEWLKESADVAFVVAGLASNMPVITDGEQLVLVISAMQHIETMVNVAAMAHLATVDKFGWNRAVVEKTLIETFVRVVASNMTKLGDDGKPIFNEDGKIMKGPNYQAPDLLDLAQRILDTANTGSTIN